MSRCGVAFCCVVLVCDLRVIVDGNANASVHVVAVHCAAKARKHTGEQRKKGKEGREKGS